MAKSNEKLIEKYQSIAKEREDIIAGEEDVYQMLRAYNRAIGERREVNQKSKKFLEKYGWMLNLVRTPNGYYLTQAALADKEKRQDFFVPLTEDVKIGSTPRTKVESPLYELMELEFDVALERHYAVKGKEIVEYVLYSPNLMSLVHFEVDDENNLVTPAKLEDVNVLQARQGKTTNEVVIRPMPIIRDENGGLMTPTSSPLAALYGGATDKSAYSDLYGELISYPKKANNFNGPTSTTPIFGLPTNQAWIKNCPSFTEEEKQELTALLAFQKIDALEERTQNLFGKNVIDKAKEVSYTIAKGKTAVLSKAVPNS